MDNTEVAQSDERSSKSSRLAARVAIVAGAFCLVVCVLLVVNLVQTRRTDPIRSAALQQLVEQLRQSPDDAALQAQVYALDQLARRAFFASQTFARSGAWLLLVGSVVLLVALRTVRPPPRPAKPHGTCPGTIEQQMLSPKARIAVGSAGIAVVLFALTLLVLPGRLRTADTTGQGGKGAAPGEDSGASDSVPTTAEILKNWPAFRGPNAIGVAHCAKAPLTWDGKSGQGILWKTEIPVQGYSSPVVWADRLFLTGQTGHTPEILCFSTKDGGLLWRNAVTGVPGSPAEPPEVTEDTGYAAPTAVTDGRFVFAIFATGDTVAYDIDGERVWARNLGVPDNHYGHSSSLLLYRDLLIVQYDHAAGAKLLTLERKTGKTVWETKREVEMSWSSPILADTAKGPQIILNSTPIVAAFAPETGKRLWALDCMSGEVAPSVAFAADVAFAANDYAVLVAIDVVTGQILWENEDAELPDVASPVATEHCVFLGTSTGVLSCFDAKTGEQRWLQETDHGFYASPVLVGDRVYAFDQKGRAHIFRAAAEFSSLGTPELAEDVVSTPAFTDGRLYVRTLKNLICIGE